MTLNEFQIYLDELVNDIENYKEAIEMSETIEKRIEELFKL